MDTTMQSLANFIRENKKSDKVHLRYRAGAAQRKMELEISGYRITAYKNRGTYISQYCNHMANQIEGLLKWALK